MQTGSSVIDKSGYVSDNWLISDKPHRDRHWYFAIARESRSMISAPRAVLVHSPVVKTDIIGAAYLQQ
jgi:hypothetical protein